MRKDEQVYNARLIKKANGKFIFDHGSPMTRLADWRRSKGHFMWVNASSRDRIQLRNQLK
jgi:hypothetical protein